RLDLPQLANRGQCELYFIQKIERGGSLHRGRDRAVPEVVLDNHLIGTRERGLPKARCARAAQPLRSHLPRAAKGAVTWQRSLMEANAPGPSGRTGGSAHALANRVGLPPRSQVLL